jgi:adenylate cyclase
LIFSRAITIALITLLLGCGIDYLTVLETTLGLDALFQLRDIRQPPEEVVIVAIDEQSKREYGIGSDFTQWRGKHIKLIQELHRQGAALIVFDLYFGDPQPAVDPALANAIKQAGNVLAGDCLQTATSAIDECGNKTAPSKFVKINPPTPKLAASLLDHGLFFLGNDPGNMVIRQCWTFLDRYDGTPIEPAIPSLPVLAWFHYLDWNGSLKTIPPASHPLSSWLSGQRKHCSLDRNHSLKDLAKTSPLENRIRDVICEGNSRFLDYYGPPKTFKLLSYSDVREGRVKDLQGKTVFIGQVPQETLPAPQDSFVTPFTDAETGRMTGVEIMATQFANLLKGREIKSPVALGLVMAAYGLIISILLVWFSGFYGMATSLVVSGIYLVLAVWCFSRSALWLPIAIPLLVQLPLAWITSLYWTHLDHLKEEARLKAIIKQITAENDRLINQFIDPAQNPKILSLTLPLEGFTEKAGVCLATDVEGYTELAQKTSPKILFDVLREYYTVLGKIVSSHGGKIVNIAGDGMIAIWVDSRIPNQQLAACLATLQSEKAVERHNNLSDNIKLPTRFGLHEGDFALGKLLAFTDVENPIGDPINIASRIEGANKLLDTKILASSSIVSNLSTVFYRPVGAFLLKGAQKPTYLMEVIGTQSEVDKIFRKINKRFTKGLKAFQRGQWTVAQDIFNSLLKIYGDDGPSKYYLAMAKAYQENPPSDWQGYIKLESK